ncbi:YidC/Oxa1 family membrane protein insertase [Thermomicrobium sp. CFH 73360]|uniref:YidC/Oxa1 family membrane protein insertase n=1 Tax=Thermomicrobium sp. CFH 73360 TaxID=2951987 RepID=UPI0020767C99|nr:YidC/Oxa1 family membrane protein insertase [Thermomicrobium sp. CFH 73360]MCM8744969.1 YidC/Oxa1 family membrane protein insertase [Thermomicrobium sp. CFH 73360]
MIIWDQFVYAIEWGLARTAELTGSAGVAIILFTILIKTVLLPLTIKSVRSTKAMQELQPKIRELQKKYGQDRQRLSAEMMKLYQEHGINPMSGCLPMLLQIPVFFGLYFAIRNLSLSQVGAWAHGFLWVPDLAQPDPLRILPILAGVFQFIQTRMTRPAGMRRFEDPQQQMMYSMMLFMPAMVVLFGWNFAAGPVLYWVVSALYSVVQQWLITGWGAMRDWLPFLPELPEHRRLGYVDPKQRVNNKGNRGGLLNRLLQQAQTQAQQGTPAAGEPNPSDRTSAAVSAPADQPPLDPAALVPRRSRSRGKRSS